MLDAGCWMLDAQNCQPVCSKSIYLRMHSIISPQITQVDADDIS